MQRNRLSPREYSGPFPFSGLSFFCFSHRWSYCGENASLCHPRSRGNLLYSQTFQAQKGVLVLCSPFFFPFPLPLCLSISVARKKGFLKKFFTSDFYMPGTVLPRSAAILSSLQTSDFSEELIEDWMRKSGIQPTYVLGTHRISLQGGVLSISSIFQLIISVGAVQTSICLPFSCLLWSFMTASSYSQFTSLEFSTPISSRICHFQSVFPVPLRKSMEIGLWQLFHA